MFIFSLFTIYCLFSSGFVVRGTNQPSGMPSGKPTVPSAVFTTLSPTNSMQPTTAPTIHPTTIKPTLQPVQSTVSPTAKPTVKPTSPTSQPTRQPTKQPISKPTSHPSSQPSRQPTKQPISRPTSHPSSQPSRQPSSQPSQQPTRQPSVQPTKQPFGVPSSQPSRRPTSQPSKQPTRRPSSQPSRQPISSPSSQPSKQPVNKPSTQPSCQPSRQPIMRPSTQPTGQPSKQPISLPTSQPSRQPTLQPTVQPTLQPRAHPSAQPSNQPLSYPSSLPTEQPSRRPSRQPTSQPTLMPSRQPSAQPSGQPLSNPSGQPSQRPSNEPSTQPSVQPTALPTTLPTEQPSTKPTMQPSSSPTVLPSSQPTNAPSTIPTLQPFAAPSSVPSGQPTVQPSTPTSQPTSAPSGQPTIQPSGFPSGQPSARPSAFPSQQPSSSPSGQPTSIPSSSPTCVLGHFGEGSASCWPCPVGHYRDEHEWTKCHKCAANDYQPDEGQIECLSCEYPLGTSQLGSTRCDAIGISLTGPPLAAAHLVVFCVSIAYLGYTLYYNYNPPMLYLIITSAFQLCNTLADLYFFLTQKMHVAIFSFVLIVVIVKISYLLHLITIKLRYLNYFTVNHPMKMIFGRDSVLWLRFVNGSIVHVNNKAAPLHMISNGQNAQSFDRLAMNACDYLIFMFMQVVELAIFLVWLSITAVIWLPVLVVGYFLMEMKLLSFLALFQWWSLAWTLNFSSTNPIKDMKPANSLEQSLESVLCLRLWKYMSICDGLVQSLPMFVLKIAHVAMFGLLTTSDKVLLSLSIIVSFVCFIHGLITMYFLYEFKRNQKSSERLQQSAENIVRLISITHSAACGSNELLSRLNRLHSDIQTHKLPTAEQQFVFAMQSYTQESLDSSMRLAALKLKSPQMLCHSSIDALSEVITHAKIHPIAIGLNAKGDVLLSESLNSTQLSDQSKHLREQLRAIGNCITIDKPFFYRMMRFYKKKFTYSVNTIRNQYRLEDMKTVYEKILWYAGITVIIMFAKIFIYFFILLFNRFIESIAGLLRHSDMCRKVFETCFGNSGVNLDAIRIDVDHTPGLQVDAQTPQITNIYSSNDGSDVPQRDMSAINGTVTRLSSSTTTI